MKQGSLMEGEMQHFRNQPLTTPYCFLMKGILESDVFTSLLSQAQAHFKHFIMHKTATDLQARWIQ